MNGTVMSVLGPIPIAELGVVDTHDHVLITSSWGTVKDSDLLNDDEIAASQELLAFRAAGGNTIVDAMPTACGRNAPGLARLSGETGVTIVATAGYHLSSYYPPWHWYHRLEEDALAAAVYEEVMNGIDQGEYNDLHISRSNIRPGMLKAAYGFHRALPEERRALRAVASVQVATGLPMMVHVEHGADPDSALDDLEDAGVDPARVVLAHMDRNIDLPLHVRVLERGAWLGYDGLYRERARPLSAVIDLLRGAGSYVDRILLGGDVARRSLRLAAGASGLAAFPGSWRQRVRSELGDDLVELLFAQNPARFLCAGSSNSSSLEERSS